MSTADIMKCRECEKYVGHKTDLENYFFWCDKTCHDLYEQGLLDKLEQTNRKHDAAYEGKPKFFGSNGKQQPNNNDVVAVEDTAATNSSKKQKKTRQKRKEDTKDIIDNILPSEE